MRNKVTLERLRELFNYNKLTGQFIRLINKGPHEKVGDVAGFIDDEGYVKIKVDSARYRGHQLAWFMSYGVWAKEIDHRNGVRSDNSIDNLRDASHSENQQNIGGARKHNKCGLLGASFNKRVGRYHSQIQVDKKKIHLGFFDTAQLAHEAYLSAKAKLHPFGARI